jgi:hypothetical protein
MVVKLNGVVRQKIKLLMCRGTRRLNEEIVVKLNGDVWQTLKLPMCRGTRTQTEREGGREPRHSLEAVNEALDASKHPQAAEAVEATDMRNLEDDHRGICGSRPLKSQPHKTPELPRQGDLGNPERLRYRHHEKGPLTANPDYESLGERA